MSNQLKRVNYSIYLDLVNSQSDRFAVGVIQKWVDERKQLVENPSDAMALHSSLHMHKTIYLAGMYMYLLSPVLSQKLVDNLGRDTIDVDTLRRQLEVCGFQFEAQPSSEANALPEQLATQLSAEIAQHLASQRVPVDLSSVNQGLAQLQQAVSALAQAEAPAMPTALDLSESSLMSLTQTMQAQGQPLQAQLMQLEARMAEQGCSSAQATELMQTLVEQQNQALAEQTQHLEEIKALLVEQQQALQQTPQPAEAVQSEQTSKELAELKAMLKAQSQMIRNLSLGSAAPASAAEQPESDEAALSQRIASVQKVKKKGLF
ncbi:hypothetical protein A3K86_09825 [Photobacterium jeanii]|uniref:Uncharacterized protein n=1 Tax=Photobacterium jeanii TaxID=858640 RepID=A0A178KJ52_9GAMM|nr:hypothetical protein [Photobacterium jeanii]OAN16734.1 hypothetical protein A3K86_09825 [Photobacterium jeanii]PST87464.1 hypothetical protein C9I91_19495 [Photobacterium jeanii]